MLSVKNTILIKIRLEIRFNNILTENKLFLTLKTPFFLKSQKSHFSKRVNPCFWSKIPHFSLFRFGKTNTRNNA